MISAFIYLFSKIWVGIKHPAHPAPIRTPEYALKNDETKKNMLSYLFTFIFGDSGNQGVASNSMDHDDCDKNLLGITLTFVH